MTAEPTVFPFIPETITVHLGAPDMPAENVTVPFTEYVKNVASSEIYPTCGMYRGKIAIVKELAD